MALAISELDVLVIDCQASGATPAHGDLLEIGWAVCGQGGICEPIHEHWIVPRTSRRVPAAVRELTGWSEACLSDAVDERVAYAELCAAIAEVAVRAGRPQRAPAVIHFARFELAFLRDLHERLGDGAEFPLDTLCLHAIAARLFPDLPRRNIRALAGYLGHSTDLLRRCGSHVQASAFIWRALVPRLQREGVGSFGELAAWLAQAAPPARGARRVYPFAVERRRALPDRPGVYRFLRGNGDLLYVGKAASLRKRVASHFAGRRQSNERVLELLTQVQDVRITETASILEAALLESDEIKRLDPPYNVQLRTGERQAWFASRDLDDAVIVPDEGHRLGPLPSRRALAGLRALIALAAGAEPTPPLQACALAVPAAFLPDAALFSQGWRAFDAAHLQRGEPSARARVEQAARALWLQRGRAELEAAAPDPPPDGWDLARVLRRLERSLIQTGLLVRRARWLCLLADADIAFRERELAAARALVLARGEVIARHALASVRDLATLPARRMPPRRDRQACFDAVCYDRLRVLATELNRVQADGGEVALRFGSRTLSASRLAALMRWV